MRKTLFIFTLLNLAVALVFSQTNVWVINAENGENMPFAHVSFKSLVSAENTKFTNVFTNNQGVVKIPSNTNGYILEISFIGYAKEVITINPGVEDVKIALKPFYNNLEQYVVTAHSVPTEISNSVYKMRVIGKERIKSQGANNLRDLLSNDLNIRVSQDNILGSRMTMQGVGGENIKIMIDGVPVVGRLGGNIDLSQINLNNIERIEIIEGPTSVYYGTNALGGVINLITKKDQKEIIEGNINTYYETVGNYNIDGNLGFKLGKNTVKLGGGRYFFDGFSAAQDTGRFQQWNPKEQYFADLAITRKIKNLQLRYTSWFYDELITNRGAPRPPFFLDALDDYYKTNRTINSVFLSGYLKNKRYIDFTASHSYFLRKKNTYFKDLTTLDEVLTGNKDDQDTSTFNLFMSRGTYNSNQDNRKVNYLFGYDINYEIATGRRITNQTQNIGDFALFTSFDMVVLKNTILKPGLRYAYNTRFNAPLIPSLNIKSDFGKGTQLRVSYARGFRAPELRELFLEFVDINHRIFGNPNLKAETSHNFNALLTLSQSTNKHSLSLEPSVFYNYIQDKIVLVMIDPEINPPLFRNENIGAFQSTGAQVNFSYKRDRANFTTGVSYIGIYNVLSEDVQGDNYFTFSPEFRTNISYKLPKQNMALAVFYKYNGRQPFLYEGTNNTVEQGFISGFSLLDLSVTRNFFKNQFQVSLYGKNMLNITDIRQQGVAAGAAHASSSPTAPVAWGRTFAIALRYNFKVSKNDI